METKLDQAVRKHIAAKLGDVGLRLADILSLGETTDSQIAESLGMKPSQVRKVLYDLYEARIAEYHKDKDKETGWLTHFWKINQAGALNAAAETASSS